MTARPLAGSTGRSTARSDVSRVLGKDFVTVQAWQRQKNTTDQGQSQT